MYYGQSMVTLLALQLRAALAAYPAPEQIHETIPGSINSTLDPGLIRRADGKLFLYTTPKDLTVFTADSLSGPWTKHPNTALYDHASNLGPGNHGAPSLHHLHDTYYLFFNSHNGDIENPGHDGMITVATSNTLEPGSWQLRGNVSIDRSDSYNILDATLLPKDEARGQNQPLLGFASYREGLYTIHMAYPPLNIAQDSNTQITHLAENKTGRGDIEGSVFFYRENWYYLFFSSGECCKRSADNITDPSTWKWPEDESKVYKVMVCRSAQPDGGYTDRSGRSCLSEDGGTEILATHDNVGAPGGQGVYNDDEAGGPIMYCHYVVAD